MDDFFTIIIIIIMRLEKKKKKIPIKISVTLRKPSTYRVYVFVLLIRVIGASLYFDSFV